MALKKEEVEDVAKLARIGIDEKEVEGYRKDLSGVLDFFKKLEELDTEKVEPIGHITGMTDVVRKDKEKDFGQIGKEDILKNAPETKDGQVKVKSVL